MDMRKKFGTDRALEVEGVDVHLGEDAYITIARAGGANAKYEAAMRRHFLPHKAALSAGTLDEATAQQVLRRSHAEAVLLGWRGIDLDGEPLPFSVDNALRLFNECPEVWRVVYEEAGKFANFQKGVVSEAGNA